MTRSSHGVYASIAKKIENHGKKRQHGTRYKVQFGMLTMIRLRRSRGNLTSLVKPLLYEARILRTSRKTSRFGFSRLEIDAVTHAEV